jgi:Raf kinase inhibitor-like YbhB/YbcL family protein
VIKKTQVIFLTTAIIVICFVGIAKVYKPYKGENKYYSNMKLTSTEFLDNQFIPSKYTCDGEDINPELNISGVPSGTKSLVLIMDDPDAPAGTWVHWIMWNIKPETTSIAEGSVPKGAVEGITSFNKTGYGGPCPHQGTHHYNFKLYALDTLLNLSPSSKKEDLVLAMQGHILEQTILIGLYKRK